MNLGEHPSVTEVGFCLLCVVATHKSKFCCVQYKREIKRMCTPQCSEHKCKVREQMARDDTQKDIMNWCCFCVILKGGIQRQRRWVAVNKPRFSCYQVNAVLWWNAFGKWCHGLLCKNPLQFLLWTGQILVPSREFFLFCTDAFNCQYLLLQVCGQL